MTQGYFITGTDTGVGKTLVAAAYMTKYKGCYFKPVQTGTADDTGDVAALTGLSALHFHQPLYRFTQPLSPNQAAEFEDTTLSPDTLALPPAKNTTLFVEGVGGLMVPLARDFFVLDMIKKFSLPVIVVARGTLGTLNHTFLTLDALRAHAVPCAGVVVNGKSTQPNIRDIKALGRTRLLGVIPELPAITDAGMANIADVLEDL